MKLTHTLTLLSLLAAVPAGAAEQILIDWNHTWSYFHPMGDDPATDDAGAGGTAAPNIDNTGAGAGELAGPDMIFPNFNGASSAAGAWFAKETDFNAPGTGYAAAIGKGFGIGGGAIGDPNLLSSFDSGTGAGPFVYGAIAYITGGTGEFLAAGTTLSVPRIVADGSISSNRGASYYRTTITAGQDYTKPRIRMVLDDGALIYFDGVLIARVNKNNDTEGYRQYANGTTAGPNENGAAAVDDENVVQGFPLDVLGAGTQAESFVSVAIPKITAGEHTIAVSCRNNNVTSSDQIMALQLRADDAGLSAAVSNIARQDNPSGAPTPGDVSDDTFSFNVVITTINMPGATGWTSDNAALNGPTTGLYAQPVGTYTFTFPAQANNGSPVNTNTIVFADSINAGVSTSVTVTAPEAANGTPWTLAPATPVYSTGFEEPPVTTVVHNRKVYHTELGFTSSTATGAPAPGGAALPGGVYQDGAVGEVNKSWRAVGGTSSLTTEALALDPSVKGVKVTMKARAFTTSGTVFETADAVSLGVETSPDGIAWTLQGNVLPVLNGSPDSTGNQAADRIVTLLGDDASSQNSGAYISVTRETVPVGAGAAFVRLRYTNAADLSGSENILLDDLSIEIASIDPGADPDNDGWTNSQEEEWGSGMNDVGSYPGFQAHNIRPGVNPGQTIQRLEYITGNAFHSYTIRVSDDLVTWTETTFSGIDDVQVHEDPNPLDLSPNFHRFFSIRSNY